MRNKLKNRDLDVERSLTDLCMAIIGACPECKSSLFACKKHGAFVAAVNTASDALRDVTEEVHKLERTKEATQ